MKPARPRRDRWLTLIEVAGIMKLSEPRRDERRRYVRRAIRRAEQRDGCLYTKRVGKSLYVSVSALESLLPYDAETFTKMGRSIADIAQIQREQGRQLNGHGARLRAVEKSTKTLEENDRLFREALDGSNRALGLLQARIRPNGAAL
jgi:hypothetical protein